VDPAPAARAENGLEILARQDLFVSGEGGYHTYRVPALAVTRAGTVLAFCEGRRRSVSDTGLIEIVLRRSTDGGRTWGATTVVVAEPRMTCGNATPTVDPRTGTIWLPFCKNREDGPEPLIFQGKAPRTAWMTKSDDDGVSWAEPWEITEAVKPDTWTWFAFGPGHGIALRSGRLLVPSVHARAVDYRHSDPCRAHVTISDDDGATWRPGGVVDVPTSSECELAEVAPGVVYLNARYEAPNCGRVSAWSRDGGLTFDEVVIDDRLDDATCQGSLEPLDPRNPARLALVNATGKSPRRERLALRVSHDAGRNFGGSLLLDPGHAAYSDIVRLYDGALLCLYERGEKHAYERLCLVRVALDAGT
jgi:sialidase-1